MAFSLRNLVIIAQATSTMTPRGQEMMLRLAHKMPDIEKMPKVKVEIHAKDAVTISVTEWPEWEVPSDLQVRAEREGTKREG